MQYNGFLECEKRWVFRLLMFAGGIYGGYALTVRGGVFANAQPANLALFAVNLGTGNWQKAVYYLIPMSSYLTGIIISELMPKSVRRLGLMRWDTLLMRMAALWIWYGLHWTVLYLFLAWLIPGIGLLYLLVLAQSFFLIALAYGVAMLTRNPFLPLVLTVLYSLACILFEMPASIFVLNSGLFAWAEILPAAVILPLGAAIALGAYQLEKRLWKNG